MHSTWCRVGALFVAAGFVCAAAAQEQTAAKLELKAAVQVTGEGIYLNQLVEGEAIPALRLCEAPAFGKTLVLNEKQVGEMVKALERDAGFGKAMKQGGEGEDESAGTMEKGSALRAGTPVYEGVTRVSRRGHTLGESEALEILTGKLQQDFVKEKGELELRFTRQWTAVTVPDEATQVKLLEIPTAGVAPSFIIRFELQTARGEHIGPWQAAVQAHVWREVWVAHSALKRGEAVQGADIGRERRDVLMVREGLAELGQEDGRLEMAEPVAVGAPIVARAVRVRPVVHRGQSVAALLQDGALAITLKVEALEDGAPGQMIRVRNPISGRDLRGKVLDEERIEVAL